MTSVTASALALIALPAALVPSGASRFVTRVRDVAGVHRARIRAARVEARARGVLHRTAATLD